MPQIHTMHDRQERIFITVPAEMSGQRLDKVLARLLPLYSRANLQQWIRDGRVELEHAPAAQKQKLLGGETIALSPPRPQPTDWLAQATAQPIALDIVAQEQHYYVLNKPAGLVVHPGAGNPDGTLVNGLLALDERLGQLPRAGIVHRLDKDTTGLIVVARTEAARQSLSEQLKQRTLTRLYTAIIDGIPVAGETINQPIGRHRQDRLRMCVNPAGKPAVTQIRIQQKFRRHSLIEARLTTGRTHQIRVHLQWRGHAVVGDPLYGNRPRLPTSPAPELSAALHTLRRQALHAHALHFIAPDSTQLRQFHQPLPADMQTLIQALQTDLDANLTPSPTRA